MNDDTIREWATSQGFEQFVRDHATVMSNLSKWLASRQSEPDQPRAEVEASEETADTEANGYPLTEAWLERDEWRARFEAECEVRRNWAIRAEAAEAECDRLREAIIRALDPIKRKEFKIMTSSDEGNILRDILLRAETPEPASKASGRTCETCLIDSSLPSMGCLACGPQKEHWKPRPAASDGKGE